MKSISNHSVEVNFTPTKSARRFFKVDESVLQAYCAYCLTYLTTPKIERIVAYCDVFILEPQYAVSFYEKSTYLITLS